MEEENQEGDNSDKFIEGVPKKEVLGLEHFDQNIYHYSVLYGNKRNDSTATPTLGLTLSSTLKYFGSVLNEKFGSPVVQVLQNISNTVFPTPEHPVEMESEYPHEFESGYENKSKGDFQDSDIIAMTEMSKSSILDDLDAKIAQMEEAICDINAEFRPIDCVCDGNSINTNNSNSKLPSAEPNFRSRMIIDEYPPPNGSKNRQFNIAPVTIFGSLLDSIAQKPTSTTDEKDDAEKEASQRAKMLKWV